MGAFLRLKGITKSFGDERIIDDLSLSVSEGRILAILGPSGCGKSTTLRIIAGLLKQDKGTVLVEGKGIDHLPAHKRNMGFVFQNYSLFPHMDVRRNIEFGLRMKGASPRKMGTKVKELLEMVGLEGMADRRPGQLSGGQQQRVALARALAIEPRLLLLDEPFGALDAKIRRRIRRDLKALQRELGVTTVFVTHDQEEAFEVGYKIAVMRTGRIDQVDLPRDLYDNPKTDFVAQFVGNVNVIKIPANDVEEGTDVMVRPEDIMVDKDVGDGTQEGVCGTLVNYVFLGPLIEVKVELANKDNMNAIMPKAEFIRKGLRRGHKVRVKILKFRTFSRTRAARAAQ
jgi:ABC-type Fe3+/spermidine/putrescine transport system ATPase subunit